MKAKRKRHQGAFKAKVALEAIKGQATIQQIAKTHQVHPTQVSQWKQRLCECIPNIFESTPPAGAQDWERERERLHAKIGQQSVEIDWLKKKCETLRL